MKPYSEYNNSDHFVREFSHNVDNKELVWHRDREDRLVEVLESDGWAFQYDNEFPFELLRGMGDPGTVFGPLAKLRTIGCLH